MTRFVFDEMLSDDQRYWNLWRHIFIQWLVTKNMLNDWMDYTIKYNEGNEGNSHFGDMTVIVEHKPSSIIDWAFAWSSTTDSKVWANLHQEWGEFVHYNEEKVFYSNWQQEVGYDKD